MKTILTIIIAFLCSCGFGQKKIKFNKDINPLIKTRAFEKAKPILQEFLKSNPNSLKGNYWLGVIYFGNTSEVESEIKSEYTGKEYFPLTAKHFNYVDSSKFYLTKTRKLVNVINLNPINARFFPDFTGLTSEELVADAIPKIDNWINLLNRIQKDWKELEKNQKISQQKLQQKQDQYKTINCKEEEAIIEPEEEWEMGGALNTKTCKWGNYYIVINTTYDEDECKLGCSEQNVYRSTINSENKIELFDVFWYDQYNDSHNFFSDKFLKKYSELKSEDEGCFEEAEFVFDIDLFYFKNADKDGITFGLENQGVMDRCKGMFGETTLKISFEEILPFVK